MPMGSCAAAIRPWQLPNAVTLNTARAQTAYLQGNGPKMMQGMFRGTMGGLELSELTVFWKIIDRLQRQNPVRRVRKPRLGRVVPQRPLWVCAVLRRRSSVGASPTRQLSLQPEATGAVMEVTKWLKPLV